MRWEAVIVIVTLWMLGQSLDVRRQHERYLPDYTVYHNLSEIQTHIRDIVSRNPAFMFLDESYKSKQGRSQLLLRLTNFSSVRNVYFTPNDREIPKTKLLLSYGEHSREFLPIETLFYLLHNITEGLRAPRGSAEDMFTRTVLTRLDISIIVLANPDGRHIVEDTQNYCWRGSSTGVDINRNFEWEFGNTGSSGNPTDEEYRGPFPFSEIECEVYRIITSEIKFDAFVSLHSGIRHIYLPFADTVSKSTGREPRYIDDIHELAVKLSTSTKHRYRYGKSYQLSQYTADGTIFDFMAGTVKIPICLAIELWGKDKHEGPSCFDEFNPPNSILNSEVADIHPLYVTLFLFLIHWREERYQKEDIIEEAPSMMFGLILLGVVILVTVLVAINKRWCHKIFPRRRIVSLKSLGSSLTVWRFKSSWA